MEPKWEDGRTTKKLRVWKDRWENRWNNILKRNEERWTKAEKSEGNIKEEIYKERWNDGLEVRGRAKGSIDGRTDLKKGRGITEKRMQFEEKE